MKAYDIERLSFSKQKILKEWRTQGALKLKFNTDFFTHADSGEPELVGLAGTAWGSFYTLLVAFIVTFPLGVGAGIYLEEFAPRNRLTDLIELHINNLAAVPSIIFGLLGLAVWSKLLGLSRPSALLGGMTLALMLCPAFVITTRLALSGVPQGVLKRRELWGLRRCRSWPISACRSHFLLL